jgi:hypothetical protein
MKKIMGHMQFVKNLNTAFKNVLLLVELALALLGISAYIEEVFAFVNALKTIKKKLFTVETVREILLLKIYFPEFFFTLASTFSSVNTTPNCFGTLIKQIKYCDRCTR